jgi:hypothetical protein
MGADGLVFGKCKKKGDGLGWGGRNYELQITSYGKKDHWENAVSRYFWGRENDVSPYYTWEMG